MLDRRRDADARDRPGSSSSPARERGLATRPVRPALIPLVLLAVLFTACGDGEPTVVCDGVQLDVGSGIPMDSLEFRGVPTAMGDSLAVQVRALDDSLIGLAPAVRRENDRVAANVPVHPSWRREGGRVDLVLTDGELACPPRSFRIEPLPAAPGATRQLRARADSTLRAQAAVFGSDLETLRTAPPDSLLPPLLPLALAVRVLDRLESRRASGDDGRVTELVDALVARSRAADVLAALRESARGLDRRLDTLVRTDRRGASRSLAGSARFPDGGYIQEIGPATDTWAGISPPRPPRRESPVSASFRDASPPADHEVVVRAGVHSLLESGLRTVAGSLLPDRSVSSLAAVQDPGYQRVVDHVRGFDEVSCSAGEYLPLDYPAGLRRPSAATLDAYMTAATYGAVGLMPGVGEYLDLATNTLGAGGVVFTGFANYSGDPVFSRSIGAAFGEAAATLETVKLAHQAWANLLPRRFVPNSLEIDLDPTWLAEDDPTRSEWDRITIRSRSKGWKLDAALTGALLDLLPGSFEDVLGRTPPGAMKAADTVFTEVVSAMKSEYAEKFTEEGGQTFCIPAQTFGPTDISAPQWSVVAIQRGDSFLQEDRHTFRPVDVGSTVIRVHTRPGRFGGGPVAGREMTLEVRQLEVRTDPAADRVRAGETKVVQAEVRNARDAGLSWSIERGAARILRTEQIATYVHQATVQVPDPVEHSAVVKATSTADRSHLRSGDEERAGFSMLSPQDLEIVPADACLEPGESVQYRVLSPAGTRVSPDVRWEATGGEIGADGTFTATAMGTASIRAISRREPDLKGSTGVEIKEECVSACRYTGTFTGPEGTTPVSGYAYVRPAEGFGSAGGYASLSLDGRGSPTVGLKVIFPEPYPPERTGAYTPNLSAMDRGDARLYTEGEGVGGGTMLLPEYASVEFEITDAGTEAEATPMQGLEFREALYDTQLKGSVRVRVNYTDAVATFTANFDAGHEMACHYRNRMEWFSEGMQRNVPEDIQEMFDDQGRLDAAAFQERLDELVEKTREMNEEQGGGG